MQVPGKNTPVGVGNKPDLDGINNPPGKEPRGFRGSGVLSLGLASTGLENGQAAAVEDVPATGR